MRGVVLATILSIVVYGIGLTPASGKWLKPCTTARLVAAWKRDGFWRTPAITDSPFSLDGHELQYVGKLHAGGRAYKIYFDDSSSPESEAHDSVHDLVVTTGRGKFLGLYNLDDILDLFGENLRTAGADVVFPPGEASVAPVEKRLHFGPAGPPHKVRHFLGYDLIFDTPAEIHKMNPNEKPWPEPGPRVADYCRR